MRPQLFYQSCKRKSLQNGSELHSKQLRLWTHKSWKFVQKFLCKPWRRRTSKMRLNFAANRFNFGRTTREIAPRTYSVKLAGRELPKRVWSSRQIPSFLDAKIEKMHPELFFNMQSEILQNAPEFTASNFVFLRKNHENAPKTFLWTMEADNSKIVSELHGKQLCCEMQKSGKWGQNYFINLASGDFPKYVWTFYVVWPENGFNRENVSRTSLKKYLNWVLWNFL